MWTAAKRSISFRFITLLLSYALSSSRRGQCLIVYRIHTNYTASITYIQKISKIHRDAFFHPIAIAGGGKASGIGLVLRRRGLRRGITAPVGGLGEGLGPFGGALGHET